ncbi:hypothetical protein GQL15_001853 [Neisseria gonorrhoeae]
MPSEPSDGIFDAIAVYRRGAGVEIPEPSFPTTPQSRNSSDNTAISKPVRQHRNLKTRHSRAGGNPDP